MNQPVIGLHHGVTYEKDKTKLIKQLNDIVPLFYATQATEVSVTSGL